MERGKYNQRKENFILAMFFYFLLYLLKVLQYQFIQSYFYSIPLTYHLLNMFLDSSPQIVDSPSLLQASSLPPLLEPIQSIPNQLSILSTSPKPKRKNGKNTKENSKSDPQGTNKRKYKVKSNKQLWLAFMEVIIQHHLLFVTWKNKLKVDLFRLVSSKLGNMSRTDVKGWCWEQKKKWSKQQGIDFLQAIKYSVQELMEKGEISESQKLDQFQRFKKMLDERDQWIKIFEEGKTESKNARKQFRELFKKIFSQNGNNGLQGSQKYQEARN